MDSSTAFVPHFSQNDNESSNRKKHANQCRVLFSVSAKLTLDLRQFDAAFGAAARDDGAATSGAHASAKAEFAGARTFFGLPGAFHDVLSSDPAFPTGLNGRRRF